MNGQHARLSASSAYRWMACPGSVNAGGPDTTSFAAAQGTIAHEVAAAILRENKRWQSFLGMKKMVDGHEIEVDQEMIDGVQLYVDEINEDAEPGDEWFYEVSLLDALQTVDRDFGGTADAVRYRRSTKSLRVFDFKYGAGVFVSAEDNKQLKVYGIGALLALKVPVEEVELTIVQPRFEGARPVRSWKFPISDILDFAADLKEAAEKTRDPKASLIPGEHCKFCPARVTCPELEKRQHALIAQEFDALPALAPEKLASALASIPLLKARIQAIEEFAYAEAQAGRFGEQYGYKLVAKRPTRKWTSDGDVIELAQNLGVDPYAPREVLSPAQLEKKLQENAPRGKKKEAIQVLAPLIKSESSGTALVPVADDRPPVKQITAADFPIEASSTAVSIFP